jgi:hypothetical protein
MRSMTIAGPLIGMEIAPSQTVIGPGFTGPAVLPFGANASPKLVAELAGQPLVAVAADAARVVG